MDLPEDEFPADDPVRKEIEKLQSHFQTQMGDMQKQLQEATSKTTAFEEQQNAATQQNALQFQSEFDSLADKLDAKTLGRSSDLSSANFHARSAVFNLVQELRNTTPNESLVGLVQAAAEQLNFVNNDKTSNENAAIRKQSGMRLGSGPSPPATPESQSDEELMRGFLQSAGLKR